MRPPTRPGFLLAIAAAVVALPAVAFGALPAGTASPAAVAANSATFQDSTGEDPAAPDITSIVVSNDDAGMLSFRINVPNRPQLGQDMVVDIFVDTDSNPATGDPNIAGVDYVMELEVGEINLYRWNGETFTRGFADPSAVTLSYSYQAGITVRISAAELGNTARFRFFAIVESGNVVDPTTRRAVCPTPPCPADLAPGGGAGLYPFEVKVAKPTLVVRRLTPAPSRPAAGKPFSLRMTVARSDTGATLQNGRVTCLGRAGNARLRAQQAAVVRRAVTCTWLIPKGAKGATFRGSVSVLFEGLRASRSYSARIR